MASNISSNIIQSKGSNTISQISSTALAQVGPSSNSEGQRRSGGSGSFGAGAVTRNGPSPRNKQVPKSQNKQSRRFRFADEDAFAESAAMKPSSRKGQTSITHLMNFSLPPRPTYFTNHNHQTGSGRRNPTWGLGSGYHSVDKARFVHANYRFIVDPRLDYHAQSTNADVYLEWATVQQILASPQSQASACPICLGEPVAPRMAKCGHIFCLPCLIRYMHSSDQAEQYPERRVRWKKCPICDDSIYISETRPVRWYLGQEGTPPYEGEDIVLRLVMRPAGSTLALPKEGHSIGGDEDIPWHFAADVMDYARVMKGTEDYMTAQYESEVSDLEQLEKHDEVMFGEDSEWTGRAIRAVNEAKEKVKGLGNGPSTSQKPQDAQFKNGRIAGAFYADTTPPEVESIPDSWDAPSIPTTSSQSPLTSALSSSLAQFRAAQQQGSAPQTTSSDYYFYQALLHYYLAPLDIRILKAAFGEFLAFPSTILPRVERVSHGHVIDDDLRKRAKYLSHLPYGCEVNFLECDWTDTVPDHVLKRFEGEIERRRKKNEEKETREEKERLRAEKEEDDKRYAAARRRRPDDPPIERFQPGDFQPLGSSYEGSTLESTSPMWSAGNGKQNGSAYASLASPGTSPSALRTDSSNANAVRTVWGTTVVAPNSPSLVAALQGQDLPNQDDGWLQDWEKDLMRNEHVITEVQAMSLAGESSKEGALSTGSGAAKKKKKGKKITLMSTTARRGA